jgi:lysophospholipase L1-like esterase
MKIIFLLLLIPGITFSQIRITSDGEIKKGNSDDVLESELFIDESKIYLSLPDTIMVGLGREFNLWWKALLKNPSDYYIKVTASNGNNKERCYRYTPTSVDTFSFNINVYNLNQKLDHSYQSVIMAVDTTGTSANGKTILTIGNSLTAGKDWVEEINELLKLNGDTLTFIGTQGTGDDLHEGRSGWNFYQFITSGSPFFAGGGLDFVSYIEDTCGESTLDFVIIQLGINEFGVSLLKSEAQITSAYTNLNLLITGILTDYPNAQIIVSLSPVCADSRDGFGDNYGNSYNRIAYEVNMIRMFNLFIENYSDDSNIHIAPTFLWIDRDYGYLTQSVNISARYAVSITENSNAVHLSASGYDQMADAIFSVIRKTIN